ncbi:hypothetical protein SAMN05216367_4866 [Tardiphaga sp. OK245]|nr:hypothetical protein SAMN05216367_4866 [Tardiphaga sp. OK245]
MALFVLLGSKGGAGRTASSIVLSAGLAAIGLRPLHLQITMSGVQPVIASANGVPFATAAIAEHDATPDAIRHMIAAHPECSTVVIDMVKRTVWDTVLNYPAPVVLFPMRRKAHEIELAVRDYRDLQPYQSSGTDPFFRSRSISKSGARRPTHGVCARLLPVAWPETADEPAVETAVARFDGPRRVGLSRPHILWPGIPEFSRDHLDDLINRSEYVCSSAIAEAAVTLARSVSQLRA